MDTIDVYSDQFTVTIGPYGANLSFGLSVAHPDPSSPKPPERIATVRMSVEHLKTMCIIIARHIKRIEGELGITFQGPNRILNQLGIGQEDWDSFWRRDKI